MATEATSTTTALSVSEVYNDMYNNGETTALDSTIETSTTRPRSVSEIYEELEQEEAAKTQAERAKAEAQVKSYMKSVSSGIGSTQSKIKELQGFMTQMGFMANASLSEDGKDKESEGDEKTEPTEAAPSIEMQNAGISVDTGNTYVPDNNTLTDYKNMVAENDKNGRKTKTLKYTDAQTEKMSVFDLPRALNNGLINNPGCRAVQNYFKNVATASIGPLGAVASAVASKVKVLPDISSTSQFLSDGPSIENKSAESDIAKIYETAEESAREDIRDVGANEREDFVTEHETESERAARRGNLAASLISNLTAQPQGEMEFF